MDMIERIAKERAKNFYISNQQIKSVKLINNNNEVIKCSCGKFRWKMYKKWGGVVRGKYNRVVKDEPIKYNFICACGERLAINEGEFSYGKVRYGCSAGECPFGKTKMDRDCLTCKYIYEK